MKLLTGLILIAIVVAIVQTASIVCDRPTEPSNEVIHTSNGQYARQDNGHTYWYYIGGKPYATAVKIGGDGIAKLPDGGVWIKGSDPTSKDLEDGEAELTPMNVAATTAATQ